MRQFAKSLRASWLMSLMVAGLAVYTFLEYRKAQNEGVMAEDERASFSFRQNDIDYLKIERSEDSVELRKRDDGQWYMVKPVEDEVEETSAMSFLLSLTTQRIRLFNPEDEAAAGPVDWAKYGLVPPAVTFEAGAGSKREALSLSSKNAFDGSYYLKKDDKLFLGDTGFAQLSARSGNSFRSRLLWREKAPADKAEVELEGVKYSVLKKDGQWTIEPTPKYALDASKIEAWLERVQEFKPADIAKEGLSEDIKREFLLLVPSAKIRLKEDWLLTIGQDRAQDVFLYTDRRPTVYKNSVQGISQIRVTPEYFRDGHKPFEFPVEQARRIEVRGNKETAVLKKSDTGWVNEKGMDISAQAVALMQNLRGLEAREWGAPQGKKTGIASSQVLVKDESGKDLLALAWGDEYKARAPHNDGARLYYARTNLDAEIFGLPKEKLEALMTAASKPEQK